MVRVTQALVGKTAYGRVSAPASPFNDEVRIFGLEPKAMNCGRPAACSRSAMSRNQWAGLFMQASVRSSRQRRARYPT
jgi:hypothetical protein